jgi:hypothetical protein
MRASPVGYTTMSNPSLCPACGARNDCTQTDPTTVDQPCWCFSVSIDPAILDALPADLRNQACLCPRCAKVDARLKASTATVR